MREPVLHFGWLATHLIRSAVEGDQGQKLYQSLAAEVRVLQAELHRAHRIIEGYNDLLSRDDSGLRWQLIGTQVFTVIILLLTAYLWYCWARPRYTKLASQVLRLEAPKEPSSDSDGPLELVTPARGPTRPSLLGKGKGK